MIHTASTHLLSSSAVHLWLDKSPGRHAWRRSLGRARVVWYSLWIRKYVPSLLATRRAAVPWRPSVYACSRSAPFCVLVVTIYFSANAYIIDAFPGYVASALAAKTVVRSGSGAAMPLFITAMYHNLGNGWAASTWAFISLGMVRLSSCPLAMRADASAVCQVPIPFFFYRYGRAIRAKSKRAAA